MAWGGRPRTSPPRRCARRSTVALEETTPAEVAAWKQNAAACARELSSENVVTLWKDAVEAIGQGR